MYQISNILLQKKMDYGVWNVVFQMDNHPLEYTTDFLYLIREKKWVFNSLVTHELTSLMDGNQCQYCGEKKIACFATSNDYKQIKENILRNEQFLKVVSVELNLEITEISTDYTVINNKEKWEQLADDNRFYGNILRIQNKNKN